MYERVLVPTDGSEGVNYAVEHAVDIANTYRAELHALHVVNVSSLAAETNPRSVIDEFEDAGEEAVAEVANRAADAGVEDVTTDVVHGVPHETILEYIDDADIDLVVMGTHGRTGLDRYLLGSLTEKIVRTSDAPVLTVSAPAEE